MFYLFRCLLFSMITIDQETFLNCLGLKSQILNFSTDVSLDTFRLILISLWEKIQEGLTLSDIENALFFIIFIRFVLLAIKYNLKTSFYITCIGFFAGYLWYRHLIDLIVIYRTALVEFPFLHKLGMDAIQLESLHTQANILNFQLGEDVPWYNPGQILYYAFIKGVTHIDPDTGLRYYIDPISMIVSNLPEPVKSKIIPYYYRIYNKIIPTIYEIISQFWNQLSGIVAYAVLTRIGKRYCPYLVRWHWTFLLMIGVIEQVVIYFLQRVYYFQSAVLIPQLIDYPNIDPAIDIFIEPTINPMVLFKLEFLNAIITCIVFSHIGFIVFGLFHAIWGQYFYIPFLVENTELHIGPRPKNSVYSGGQTAWQEPKEKEKSLNRLFPKLWYGLFGRGTDDSSQILNKLKKLIKKSLRKLIKKIIRKLKK